MSIQINGNEIVEVLHVVRIVGSIVSCLSFPIGTAAGVYGLWFLFGDLGKQFYLGSSPQYAFQNPPAPPPNSWQ